MDGAPPEARAILAARGVDYVAICTTSREAAITTAKAPDGLLAHLLAGASSPWLEPVPAAEPTRSASGAWAAERIRLKPGCAMSCYESACFVFSLILAALLAARAGERAERPAKELFGGAPLPAALASEPIGFYSRGCMAGAVALPPDGPYWQAMRLSRNRHWGLPILVDFLQTLARDAAARRTAGRAFSSATCRSRAAGRC